MFMLTESRHLDTITGIELSRALLSICLTLGTSISQDLEELESGGRAHNASEASTRARIAPEEGEGVGGGIPLARCGNILKVRL